VKTTKDIIISSLCSMGGRSFMQVTKKGDAFFVYAILAPNPKTQQHKILIQYQDYKYAFEKKNVDTLPKHSLLQKWGAIY
jgi:hypothetical protein